MGATLYATLTGVIPEDGLARMTGKAKLTPIRELAPKVNRRLADTIERALEIDSDDRYQTGEEFKCALIESGELSNYYKDRPAISPPPSSTTNGESNGAPEEDLEESPVSKPSIGLSRKRLARKRRLTWTVGFVLLTLVIATALLFAARPDLPRSVMAYFTASPTSAKQATEIAGIQISPTGSVVMEPTTTSPAGGNPANPIPESTSTPTVEPTFTLTPTITQTSVPTATPRGGGMGQIAFASDRGGNMQIWMMDLATKKARQITSQKDGACQPTWSPDGLRLAFVSPCPAKQDSYPGGIIYALNLDLEGNPDLSSISQLTSWLQGDFDPTWSPDGKRIAFTRLSGDKSAIAILNLKDLSVEVLSNYSYADKQPAWNPSGMQLAFVRQFLTTQIWVMYSNGEKSDEFSPRGPVNNLWPAWSTDGQVIFYSQTSSDSNVPILVYRRYEDRNTPNEMRIPTNPKSDTGPISEVNPSPDGSWLAFESWPDGKNHDIYIMNINGSNRERLTTDPGWDFGPVWRPLKVQVNAQP